MPMWALKNLSAVAMGSSPTSDSRIVKTLSRGSIPSVTLRSRYLALTTRPGSNPSNFPASSTIGKVRN